MRRALSVLLVAVFAAASTATAQTADEVIAKNIAAKGGLDLIRATTSVKMTGRFKPQVGAEMPMTTWAKRPNLMRREATATPPAGQKLPPGMESGPQKVVQASDGTTVWTQYGSNPAQAAPSSQAASNAVQDAEFDSVFVDYKTRGITIDLVGQETLADRPVYHLKVSRKNGPVQHYYLDVETGLEAKIVTEVSQGGATMKVETEIGDYRKVEGRMVPFRTRQLVDGKPAAEMTVESVEFNIDVPDSLFKMPPSIR